MDIDTYFDTISDEELVEEVVNCVDDGAYNVYGEGSPAHELIRRYKNKKAECEQKDKLLELRVKRQVQLHSRTMELKEAIGKAWMILDKV